tara:strand:- start:37 stop:261 length:225 start_codon:yes stop_codon:yes gene_type:complete
MRRFLFVTLFASLLIPTVAKAESVWLVLLGKSSDSMEKIQMQSMEQCEEEAKKWVDKVYVSFSKSPKYICLKGK